MGSGVEAATGVSILFGSHIEEIEKTGLASIGLGSRTTGPTSGVGLAADKEGKRVEEKGPRRGTEGRLVIDANFGVDATGDELLRGVCCSVSGCCLTLGILPLHYIVSKHLQNSATIIYLACCPELG